MLVTGSTQFSDGVGDAGVFMNVPLRPGVRMSVSITAMR
jgi:hypothetical protein